MSRKQRITTALVLAPLPILAVLFLPTPWLAAAVAAVMLAGLWEWTAFAGLEDKPARLTLTQPIFRLFRRSGSNCSPIINSVLPPPMSTTRRRPGMAATLCATPR